MKPMFATYYVKCSGDDRAQWKGNICLTINKIVIIFLFLRKLVTFLTLSITTTDKWHDESYIILTRFLGIKLPTEADIT